MVHAVISTTVGNPIAGTSFFLWRTRGNPLFLLPNLIPGALRLGTIIASEKIVGVQFSRTAKVLSFWPFFPSGLAMPIEIASTLGKRQLLLAKIKKRYLPSLAKIKIS